MNKVAFKDELIKLNYKQHQDFDNTFYQWVNNKTRVTFIFAYDLKTACGYVTYHDLISSKEDMDCINQGYDLLQKHSKIFSDLGIKIEDYR